jgi:hypothetical protein
MRILLGSLFALLVATPTFAQTSAASSAQSPLDRQIAALKVDVPRVEEIMMLVARNEGQPTKEIHDEFWGLILTRIHAAPAALRVALSQAVDEGMQVQTAFWQSLLMSAQSHRVAITKQYAALRNIYPKAKFTSNYTAVQNGMLTAAADGKPYVMSNGKTISITVQVAKHMLNRIEAVKARLDKLCNPNWQG